jgi:hypothetical protein
MYESVYLFILKIQFEGEILYIGLQLKNMANFARELRYKK